MTNIRLCDIVPPINAMYTVMYAVKTTPVAQICTVKLRVAA